MKHMLLAVALVLSPGWLRCQAQDTEPDMSFGGAESVAPVNAPRSALTSCEHEVFKLASGPSMSVQRLLGTRVTNPLGEDVGEITDVLLDRHGHMAAIVVQIGGFLGLGGQSVRMSLDKVRITPGPRTKALTVTVFDTRDHIFNAREQPEPAGQ